MNTRFSQSLLRGGIITSLIVGGFLLLGGFSVSAAGMHGHGPGEMLPTRDFVGHHVLLEPQHGGFPGLGVLVFFIIGMAIVVFLMKWFKRKAKATSMEQFIQTTLASSYRPMESQKEHILDQWEHEINKKENI